MTRAGATRRARVSLSTAGIALAVTLSATPGAATDRVVLVISPPTAETNRFWAGGD